MRARAFGLVVALSAVGALARAATLCVNPAGSPAGVPCYDTIQHAVDASAAAGVINVQAGMYFENVNVPASLDGLQIVGAGKLTTILDADDPNIGPGIVINSNGVALKSLTIQNGINDSVRVRASDVVITGLRIVNARYVSGVSQGTGCDSNPGPGQGYAIYIGNGYTGTQVLSSEFHSNYCYDVGSDLGGRDNDGTIVAGNVFDNGYYQTVKIFGNGVQVLNNKIIADDNAIEIYGDNALIQGNTVNDTHGYTIVYGDRFVIQDNRAINSFAIWGDCSPGAGCTGGTLSGNVTSGATYQSGGVWSGTNGPGVMVHGNKITGAGYSPLFIYADNNTTAATEANANILTGGGLPYSPCVRVLNGNGHSLVGNSVSKCGDTAFYVGGGVNTRLEGNRALGGYGNGFTIDGGSGVIVINSTASGFIGEAFAVVNGTTGTTLTGNAASKSRVNFCDAGSGTVDGGGNSFLFPGVSTCDILR